jgi:DNA-binding XRE family transcriptional regulator
MKVKPFPWKCAGCREKAVVPAVVDYTTTIEHDGPSYDVRLPALLTPRCANCGKLVLVDSANRAISEAFRAQVGLLAPAEIRRQRQALGLTQKALAERLGIAEATLCRWETGGQIPQGHLDLVLRAYFLVPAFRAFLEGRVQGKACAADEVLSAADPAPESERMPTAVGRTAPCSDL